MNFSIGKYLNESLKISVNAEETKSSISGFMNGKNGCQVVFIRKSAIDSSTTAPLNKSDMCKLIPPILSMTTRTLRRLPENMKKYGS